MDVDMPNDDLFDRLISNRQEDSLTELFAELLSDPGARLGYLREVVGLDLAESDNELLGVNTQVRQDLTNSIPDVVISDSEDTNSQYKVIIENKLSASLEDQQVRSYQKELEHWREKTGGLAVFIIQAPNYKLPEIHSIVLRQLQMKESAFGWSGVNRGVQLEVVDWMASVRAFKNNVPDAEVWQFLLRGFEKTIEEWTVKYPEPISQEALSFVMSKEYLGHLYNMWKYVESVRTEMKGLGFGSRFCSSSSIDYQGFYFSRSGWKVWFGLLPQAVFAGKGESPLWIQPQGFESGEIELLKENGFRLRPLEGWTAGPVTTLEIKPGLPAKEQIAFVCDQLKRVFDLVAKKFGKKVD